ncbi:MAG: hypothetical protein V7719_17895, partial [Psychroserpens sp.]
MMKRIRLILHVFVFLALGITALNAQNESAVDESNLILDFGAGNQYYNLFNSGNPNFQGTNFGNFNCGDTFILNGAQQLTHKCGDHNISSSELNYRIYQGAPPAFTPVNILHNTDLATFNYCTGTSNDQNWQTAAAGIDILSGLAPGTYNIEVYTTATYESVIDGNGTHFISNLGANFIATFTLIDTTAPTPDAASLSDILAECEVTTLTAPTASDNCLGSVTVTNDASLPISGEGTTTVVTWTYDDGNGNTSTQLQNVIIDDVTAPVADAASLSDILAECEVTTLTAPTASDNCLG